ncbi:MAG: NAD+ synthase [Lentimicrobium sp.]|nr:NAD+ synthase [Lentimicrobium sp.]
MKIALAQLNYHIGNFEENTHKIKHAIHDALQQKAEIVVFAELALTGYPPLDLLEYEGFIKESESYLQAIAAECIGITAIVGAPAVNRSGNGKRLYNSAWVLSEGKVQQIIHKSLLPNYDVFDEYRHFEPASEVNMTVINGHRLAITICEDIWNTEEIPLYTRSPLDHLMKQSPEIILNIAASPFNYLQPFQREKVLHVNALKYKLPIVYVNQTGAQTELIFDGDSMACDSGGNIRERLANFTEEIKVVEIDESWYGNPAPPVPVPPAGEAITSLIHDALICGITDYFRKSGFTKAILGLSGGLDSAVVMALAAESLGPENVRAVLLPSPFSSEHSIADAKQLALNLGSPYDIIPINEAFKSIENSLAITFAGTSFGVTEENIQARVRGVILMAMSNKFGYILLNTSNKSEAAVGYGTLYGDMCGGMSVLGDVYKTQVYDLARYINRNVEIIPQNTIVKPPSAELRPDQKDSDSLPDYSLLDNILYHYIELRQGEQAVINQGFDPAVVKRVIKMVNANEWKRHQTAPVLRVSLKAFGMGRRMPVVGKY